MINTPLLPTGALRIAIGNYENMDNRYADGHIVDSTKDIDKNWKTEAIGNRRYRHMEVHYINPSQIVDIIETRYSKKDYPCNDSIAIKLSNGDVIKTDSGITREKIIECANEALKTGKAIDLIA